MVNIYFDLLVVFCNKKSIEDFLNKKSVEEIRVL